MALIATKTSHNGVVVRVFDDCMTAPETPEGRRRIAIQRRIAQEIIMRRVEHNGTDFNQWGTSEETDVGERG